MPKSQSLRAVACQSLIIGFEAAELTSETKNFLREAQPAGVILFARNIQSADQTHALLAECRGLLEAPALLAVDMEGGTVDRLKNVFAPVPSAAAVFATHDKKLFHRHGELIGRECALLGFNLDFAPVLDLALPESRNVLSSRAVSSDPKQVTVYAREFLAGLRANAVFGCAKHFPGLGAAALDTHAELPQVQRSLRELLTDDIAPYRTLKRQLPFILISHASYPAIENKPATLCRSVISGVLKTKLRCNGLVVSDDMEMGALLSSASIEQAAVEFLRAGGDLLLVCRRHELVTAAYESLVRTAERDSAFRRQVQQAARRVLAFKSRNKVLLKRFPPQPSNVAIDRLRDEIESFRAQVAESSNQAAAPLAARS